MIIHTYPHSRDWELHGSLNNSFCFIFSLYFPQTCWPANHSDTCSAIAVSLPVSKCTKFQAESQAMFLFAFIMGYRLLLRGADSSLGNVRITWGCAEFVEALLGRTICDHLPKSLMIYCECLFSESPALSFGTAGIFISQLGLSCSRKEKAICKMKWQTQKKKERKVVVEGWWGGALHWIFCSPNIFGVWHLLRGSWLEGFWDALIFIFNVWPYGANLGAHKIRGCYFLCVFISFKGILRVPFQLFASLADYEPDNLPQPIRMPLSGLQRPSQAQLLV